MMDRLIELARTLRAREPGEDPLLVNVEIQAEVSGDDIDWIVVIDGVSEGHSRDLGRAIRVASERRIGRQEP